MENQKTVFKANFRIEKDIWQEYKKAVKKLGSMPSTEIRKFVIAFVEQSKKG